MSTKPPGSGNKKLPKKTGSDLKKSISDGLRKESSGDSGDGEKPSLDEIQNDKLDKLVEKVEVISASLSEAETLRQELLGYAQDARDEINTTKTIRWVSSTFALILVCILIAIAAIHFFWLKFNWAPWQLSATLFATTITTSAALVLVVVRSSFQNFGARNEGLPLPGHFKEILDQLIKINSRGEN